VSGQLKRWWKKFERLPLGKTDGQQMLWEETLRQAKLLREEQLRHGIEERERLMRVVPRSQFRKKGAAEA
jgi:hypothetical protein